MPEHDADGWTVYEDALCKCVGARVCTISTKGSTKTVFILDLAIKDSGTILTRYFNVNKTAKGNYSVPHDGYFAKLYRLTIGENPVARYSRADQLLHHLRGHEFIADYIDASTAQIPHYFKVTKLKPANPIIMDDWYPTGTLIPKKWKRKARSSNNGNSATKQQPLSNDTAKNKQKNGNDMAMVKVGEADSYLGSAAISIPQQHLKHDIEPLHHMRAVSDSFDRYVTTVKQPSPKEKVFTHHRWPDETEEQYHERVIDESMSSW